MIISLFSAVASSILVGDRAADQTGEQTGDRAGDRSHRGQEWVSSRRLGGDNLWPRLSVTSCRWRWGCEAKLRLHYVKPLGQTPLLNLAKSSEELFSIEMAIFSIILRKNQEKKSLPIPPCPLQIQLESRRMMQS